MSFGGNMISLNGCLTPIELADLLGGITVHGVYKALKTHAIDQIQIEANRKKILPEGVRRLLIERGFEYPRLNISFQIVKGGVGKTSLSYGLGLRASHYGARVLLIDLDQQANLTKSLQVQAREVPVWINVIRDRVDIKDSIIELSSTLHLLPSNLNNSKLDVELTQSTQNLREMVIDKLSSIRDNYDLVIFDCPPAINKINLTATCASDIVIIPVNADEYAMDGLDYTSDELDQIKKDFKLNFQTKIIWNRYDGRERLGNYYMHSIIKDEDKYKKLLTVVIRVDASLRNSISEAISIFDLPKRSTIREDMDQFAREILGISQWTESLTKKTNVAYA
jgi:chromosome partitioning protein